MNGQFGSSQKLRDVRSTAIFQWELDRLDAGVNVFWKVLVLYMIDELGHQILNHIRHVFVGDAHALNGIVGSGPPCDPALDAPQVDRYVGKREFQPDRRSRRERRLCLDKATPPAHIARDTRENRVDISTRDMNLESIPGMPSLIDKTVRGLGEHGNGEQAIFLPKMERRGEAFVDRCFARSCPNPIVVDR